MEPPKLDNEYSFSDAGFHPILVVVVVVARLVTPLTRKGNLLAGIDTKDGIAIISTSDQRQAPSKPFLIVVSCYLN